MATKLVIVVKTLKYEKNIKIVKFAHIEIQAT